MPDVGNSAFSETDANNNTASPSGFPEGMAPSGVNDSARAVMGALKRFWNRINGVKTTAGTAAAQTLSYDIAAGALYTGEIHAFKVGAALTSTSATTLNRNSLGAKNLKLNSGSAVIGGELQAGDYNLTLYDGTDERILLPHMSRGTFTPALTLGSGSVTYTTQIGFWERIGNIVHFWINIQINAASTPSGTLSVGTLPFVAQNTSNYTQLVNCGGNFITTTSSIETMTALIAAGADTITVRGYQGDGTLVNPGNTIGASGQYLFSGSYRVAT